MIETIVQLDQEFFLWLNGLHNEFSDKVFWVITSKNTWIPLYISIIVFLFMKYGWKKGGVILLAVVASIGLADQIASGLFKPMVGRLRPSHEPALQDLVHIVNGYRGGKYGFFSSHASTTMALASSLFLFLKDRYKWVWLFFPWSFIVAYSRIAVGVHYPLDIFFGLLTGFLSALLLYFITHKLWNKYGLEHEGSLES